HLAGHLAVILVHHRHGDLRRWAVLARAAEDVPEERSDQDGRREAHRHRTLVHEEQAQVAPHQSPECRVTHRLRTLLPVKARNTVSRSARWLLRWLHV